MAKMTIAQLREKSVEQLAMRINAEPTEVDLELAKKIMNSYYRLCGLCERLLYLQNDEKWCNSLYVAELEKQEERWVDRLDIWLKPYDCILDYAGYFPEICRYSEKRTHETVITPYFYD